MKFKKKRKPRGMKLNGLPSHDMCPHCYMPGCSPCSVSHNYYSKVKKRLEQGLCPACGQAKCKCKSTILTPEKDTERQKWLAKKRKTYLEKTK